MSTNQQPTEVPNGGQNNGGSVVQPLSAAASASTTATAPPNNTNTNNQPQDSDANNNAPKPKKKRKAPISSKAKRDLLGYFRRVTWPEKGKKLTDKVLNEVELATIVKSHKLGKGQVQTQLGNYKKNLDKPPQSEEKTVCPSTADTLLDPIEEEDER